MVSRETSDQDSREQSEVGDPEQSQDMWFQPLLKTLAETQKQIAKSIGNGGTGPKKNLLANVKLDEVNGGRAVTDYQYRAWKKSVGITQELHSWTDTELALVIFTQVGGKARQQLDVLEIEDLKRPDGLEMIWSLLDKSHEKMVHERLDDAFEK